MATCYQVAILITFLIFIPAAIQMKKLFPFLVALLAQLNLFAQGPVFYVSPKGSDQNPGSLHRPFLTPQKALQKASAQSGKNVTIEFMEGSYPLSTTLELNAENCRFQSLQLRSYQNQKVVWSGAASIKPIWKEEGKGLFLAHLSVQQPIDRLFLNGKALPMARYPDYDSSARVFFGASEDALAPSRIASWKNPSNGYIHALHQGEWGGMHFRITGKSADEKLTYDGGWQNNRPSPMHKRFRYVENIFEELDPPGEWFYDVASQTLYLIPPVGTDLKNAVFEISQITDLLHIKGTVQKPAANITITGIIFRQNNRSFMETREPLLRSDWTIYRGAALLLEGTEKVEIKACEFTELGGNAIFLSGYNKNNRISNNHIHHIGASGILFVGNSEAVRSPAFRYELAVSWDTMDYKLGPQSKAYPQQCTSENNLIHHIGLVEKQVAGVQIEMASQITVDHNTIYQVPRAGINIGDGCWGGHLIQFNDVFRTVLETGDHGAFNSWGRDRFWSPDRHLIDSIVAAKPGIEFLDAIRPTVLRNNRFQCEHGWDIDLDDGSSNYEIYNNLCLSGGLKLREGYHRKVYNNILVNNSFHPHVWLKNSDDLFKHNIVSNPHAPIQINDWGHQVDSNFFLAKNGWEKARKLGIDAHSSYGDPGFAAALSGGFQVKAGSLVERIGFRNFEMDFGVTDPILKKLAERPVIKPLYSLQTEVQSTQTEWLGGRFKSIETLGEQSAAGLPERRGALLLNVQPNGLLGKSALKVGDVVVKMGDEEIVKALDLWKAYEAVKWMGSVKVKLFRNQQEMEVELGLK
jgi:hypothetical protein